jgi:hypothetical protein
MAQENKAPQGVRNGALKMKSVQARIQASRMRALTTKPKPKTAG